MQHSDTVILLVDITIVYPEAKYGGNLDLPDFHLFKYRNLSSGRLKHMLERGISDRL
jgi:hypothetical protein